ncbi:sodium:alanine symporter family protein [Lutibacter sp. B2]|nr:sodium:alanine symporter family protein [Lutibacter sp. B2]
MEKILDSMVGFLWGKPLIFMILFTGLYFMIGTKCFQFSHFGHIMSQTFGKLLKKTKDEDNNSKGVLSPLEAVSTAIGGSVGVGNMGGVATAIAVGGPGAVFWMWVTSLIGMLIKTGEVTLAVYYRNTDEEGFTYGGPTYYMEKGLGEEKGFKLWTIPALIFGFGIFATFPITLQNYTVSEAVSSTFGLNMITVAIIYVIVNYLMILGGIKTLGKIASKIVPIMCLFYIIAGVFIIGKNIGNVGPSFSLIFSGAFNGTAALGGFTGAAAAQVIRLGIARAVFSNEAGWGTSPMIHSTAKTDHPVKQGMWGAFEVFIDTMVVCTITALVIIITGEWSSGASGATLTLNAFEHGIGSMGRKIVAIGVFLFGVTTSSGWYSYYEIILRHALKEKVALKNNILKVYKAIYPFPGLLMVIYVVKNGLPGKYVWYFADITSAIPTFANVFTILLLGSTFFKLIKDYKARYLGIGKVDENFKVFYEDKKDTQDKKIVA